MSKSIFYNIIEKANVTASTGTDWYANELRSELTSAGAEMIVSEIRVGDFIFFEYFAEYPQRYPYYDRRPLAFIMEMKNDKMLGCNVHYKFLLFSKRLYTPIFIQILVMYFVFQQESMVILLD